MLDWLTVGNGYRNLFLLSSALQALALGTLFAKRRLWVKRSRVGAFLAGAAVTPLAQFLWMLLLAVVWPRAPKMVYIGVPPVTAGVYLFWLTLRYADGASRRLRAGLAGLRRLTALDKPALASLCFALAMAVLLAPICIRTATSAYPAQADSGEYMALGLRYCEDRDLSGLLEKEDTTGHFRGHSHFPSLELYMAYGLMHTGGDYGYPFDKPMFTGIGLLVLYLLMAYAALLLQVAQGKRRWVLLGLLLFNLVPNLVYSLSSAPRDTWRCLALLSAAVGLLELRPTGGVRRYLGKLFFVTVLCFTAMSAHVVGFVVLPFIVVAWVALTWLLALYRREGHALRTLLGAVGLALGGAAGTLAAYAGNLWCYFQWGEMSPWRLMTTFTDAPWYAMYMQGEYKLEVTTTHLNFWQARMDIVMAYATPIGLWGMRLAAVGLLCVLAAVVTRRLRSRGVFAAARGVQVRECFATAGTQDTADAAGIDDTADVAQLACQADAETPAAANGTAAGTLTGGSSLAAVQGMGEPLSATGKAPAQGRSACPQAEAPFGLLAAALLTLCTLAPMSGLLDTKLYSFSGSFLTMQRYTLQWYLFAACAITAALAALEGVWPRLLAWLGNRLRRKVLPAVQVSPPLRAALRRVPAYACAVLCALAFAQGTVESGYANSFYRYGRPMLTDPSMALDVSFQERYGLLLQLRALVGENRKILVSRAGYQYALRAKGYVLTSNPIVPLMNLPVEAVPIVLAMQNVAALCTEPDFWDGRYFALSTLSQYLNSLPPEQIVEDGHMRVYLLDASLVGKLHVPALAE